MVTLLVAALLVGCSSTNNNNSIDEEVYLQSNAINFGELNDYALIFSKYFQSPVQDIEELENEPNFFLFLIDINLNLYFQNKLHLENDFDTESNPQYIIPNIYMEKASNLFLGISEIPDKFYSEDFGYDKERDCFLVTSFREQPMVLTNIKNTSNSESSIEIEITDIKKNIMGTNIYTFIPITDSSFGVIYQIKNII